MARQRHSFFIKFSVLALMLLFASTSLLSAQAGWKTVRDQGFSFKYPSDWNFKDLGGDDYGGTMGYIKALSPPEGSNFAIVIMLFPKFKFDLEAENMTYADFMKAVFESALKESKQDGAEIDESDAAMKHGKVPAFMAVAEESDEAFKASMICGDMVGKNAAIIMVTMDLQGEDAEKGKEYLEQAEAIMASFAFPK